MKNPEFIMFVGPMASGKTTSLLAMLEKYKYQHKKVFVFKPDVDDRYSQSEIVTHNNFRHAAIPVQSGKEIIEHLTHHDTIPDVVAVDEAFMVKDVSETLVWLYRTGVSIVVSTLDVSATGKVFSEVRDMMPWATRIKKCTAVCTVCGSDAHYTHKKVVSEKEIEVGGMDAYEPRCMAHHGAIRLL